MPDTVTRQIGARIYIYRGDDEMLGWLDKEYPPSVMRRGNLYTRTAEWTGRWIAFASCRGEEIGPVTSPAEGLLMITRVTEIDETN